MTDFTVSTNIAIAYEYYKNPQLHHKYGITEDFMLSGLVEYTC